MWLQSSLLWAGMALVASAKSYHVDKLDHLAPRDTQGCNLSTTTFTSTQTSTVNSTVTSTNWVTQYVNAVQNDSASATGANASSASGTGKSYSVVNISPTSTGAVSSASASASATSSSSAAPACPTGNEPYAYLNFSLVLPEYTGCTGMRGNNTVELQWYCSIAEVLIMEQWDVASDWLSKPPKSVQRCGMNGYPTDPANADVSLTALTSYPWLIPTNATSWPAGGVLSCSEICTGGNISLSVPSGMSIQDSVTGNWTVGPALQSVERACQSGPYNFSIATNGSTLANCMLSGYASANDTVRTFDLAPSSPWATTNISVWTNTSPLNITCWTPTTQPLNCSSANTNSSTGGVTVNMIAGNSTLMVFERGYEANGTTWVPVQLTGYNTGSMNRLYGQQPASINASVWATGADISTTPAIANLMCLLSGYPAGGETPTVMFINTPPHWSLLQEYGDMYMDCTTS